MWWGGSTADHGVCPSFSFYYCIKHNSEHLNQNTCVCFPVMLQESSAPKPLLLAELLVPGNAGRAFGALTADRNPIHISSITSQVRPCAGFVMVCLV